VRLNVAAGEIRRAIDAAPGYRSTVDRDVDLIRWRALSLSVVDEDQRDGRRLPVERSRAVDVDPVHRMYTLIVSPVIIGCCSEAAFVAPARVPTIAGVCTIGSGTASSGRRPEGVVPTIVFEIDRRFPSGGSRDNGFVSGRRDARPAWRDATTGHESVQVQLCGSDSAVSG
jgi:hypothetical protein